VNPKTSPPFSPLFFADHRTQRALEHLDQLDEATYREVTLQMQLLRDNLATWTEGADRDESGNPR
jgi:hypothetical protein